LRDPKGFTAIEMAVTVTVAGILSGIAVASISPLIESRKMREASQQIEQTLRKAQQYAITKDRIVYVKFNNPNTANFTYDLVVGDPCDATVQSSINTNRLGQNMTVFGTTFQYGRCTTASADLNVNIVAFGSKGDLVYGAVGNAAGGPVTNVGQCVSIDDTATANNNGYLVCLMTAAGDISSWPVTDVTAGVPGD
jgi:prepilin-type N-terminal cleavage/methylation domain-containing protein